MSDLNNRIDFGIVLFVNGANPNGDPQNENYPRMNDDGYGIITDVCAKRKIRDRAQDEGQSIFVQSDGKTVDEYKTLKQRYDGELSKKIRADKELVQEEACKKWLDVRAFGQTFLFSKKDNDGDGVSIGIRGPVSVRMAHSVLPIADRVEDLQITKSVSGYGDGKKKSSDTFGSQHFVMGSVYVIYGSINVHLAKKTGFSREDADFLKSILPTLFVNDSSSARPAGSMKVDRVVWWEHNSEYGDHSTHDVHNSLKVTAKVDKPQSMDDYDVSIDDLDGLEPEVIMGI